MDSVSLEKAVLVRTQNPYRPFATITVLVLIGIICTMTVLHSRPDAITEANVPTQIQTPAVISEIHSSRPRYQHANSRAQLRLRWFFSSQSGISRASINAAGEVESLNFHPCHSLSDTELLEISQWHALRDAIVYAPEVEDDTFLFALLTSKLQGLRLLETTISPSTIKVLSVLRPDLDIHLNARGDIDITMR